MLAFVDVLYSSADIVLYHNVQTDRRLVEEQHLGIVQQRSRDVGAHTLAEREGTHGICDKRLQIKHLVEKRHLLMIALLGHLIDLLQHSVGLAQGQIPPKLSALAEHYADFLYIAFAVLTRVFAVDRTFARGWRKNTSKHFYNRALAGAVWPDEPEDLALGNRKAYVINRNYFFGLWAEQRFYAAL